MFNRNRSWSAPLPLAFLALWGGLALLMGPNDLYLSRMLADTSSQWARFFEVYGEHPAVLFAWAGSHLLLASSRLRKDGLSFTLRLPLLAANVTAGYALLHMTAERAFHVKPTGLHALLSLLAVAAAALLVQRLLARLSAEYLARFERAALLSLLLVAAELAAVHALKWGWGRIRFRDLLPDYSNFTAWYLPQGPNGNRSFPSAHAANSWTMLLLPGYVAAAGVRAYWRYAAWGCAIVWASCTSLSRIVMGAHYATDILFGACITISLYWVLHRTLEADTASVRLRPFTQRSGLPK
ncbi:phosphatase PAP2 family protein [Paenibacillus validus]|uniref:phosphatase PAP2 family protein n=1 Tax=Paenibacillus validus TaxID=44253 RepID=UPI003D292CE8